MAKDKEVADKLQIGVRIRPLKAEEAGKNGRTLENVDKNLIILHEQTSTKLDALREKRRKEMQFAYDVVFGETSTQSDVYKQTARELIPFVLQGFNATVFAYGPTGSGKTFTMVGTHEQPGIMVMALNDLFSLMRKGDEKFTVSMSYLEIYNENIRDLLVSNSKTLELREDPKSGVMQVAGLTQVSTTSTEEVMKLLHKGNQRRKCEETAANKTSSRSHALLQINVRLSSQSKSMIGEQVKTGRLFCADLAGSERARRTENVGLRLTEGAHINKSLLALGNVINALAEGTSKFVNFRDSKLTRLLKDALTGNCKTVMIAHVSPAGIHREESRNTLIYADKAKKISIKSRPNIGDVSYHISQYQTIIGELKDEIGRLKSKLSDEEESTDSTSKKKRRGKDKGKVGALKLELIEAFNEQMSLRKKLMEIDNSFMRMSLEFETQNQVIQEYENEKQSKKRGRRFSSPDSGSDSDEDDSDDEEPEEIVEAWEDLIYIHNEQKRYADMKENITEELEQKKARCKEIEESLPKETSCDEQKELLALLCRVHELEIHQAEMESMAILKEHDLQRRDLWLNRFDRQMNICDKIITKQRSLLLDSNNSFSQELEELYALYKLESQFTQNLVRSGSLSGISRSNSVLSLRPDKLPPINKEPEKLFKPGRRQSLTDDRKPSTPLSISSPVSSPQIASPPSATTGYPYTTVLPPIKGGKQSSSPLNNLSSEVKQPRIRNNTSTVAAVKRLPYKLNHMPNRSSVSHEILVLESPRGSLKCRDTKRGFIDHKLEYRGSLPGLPAPLTHKVVLRPSSDGDTPVRRGRQQKKKSKSTKGTPPLRRGNSLSRIQDKRKGESKAATGPKRHLNAAFKRPPRSKSD